MEEEEVKRAEEDDDDDDNGADATDEPNCGGGDLENPGRRESSSMAEQNTNAVKNRTASSAPKQKQQTMAITNQAKLTHLDRQTIPAQPFWLLVGSTWQFAEQWGIAAAG